MVMPWRLTMVVRIVSLSWVLLLTGYYLKKYCDGSVNISSVNSTNSPYAWIMFRLGEFYLNYAEATFKYLGNADATTVELPMSARQAVNVIRNRQDVKMPELAEGLNNDEFGRSMRTSVW